MRLVTWNVNSVKQRLPRLLPWLDERKPDVLCLQETKCPDDKFPLKRFKRLGYDHVAMNGQKGYHGVVVLSRLPFESTSRRGFCGLTDSRHISVVLGEQAGLKDPILLLERDTHTVVLHGQSEPARVRHVRANADVAAGFAVLNRVGAEVDQYLFEPRSVGLNL